MGLSIESFTDASILSDFYCGLQQMDDFIHQELQSYLHNDCYAYCLKTEQQEIIAFIVLRIDIEVLVDNEIQDDLVLLYDIELPQEQYNSVEIEYLAVAESWQRKRIGYDLINEIENLINKINPNHSIDLITVSAFKSLEYSTIPFYKKCNFSDMEYNNPCSNTLRMYKPLKH